MRVEELQVGSNIILHVDIDGRKGDFPSTVIDVDETGMFAQPIRINNKVLGFSSDNIKLTMSYITGESSPIFWRGITCETIVRDGKTVYSIRSSYEGFEQNRREAFRVFVGVTGIAQLGINTKAIEVNVKDVSETGFSFLSDVDVENFINIPIRLTFKDMEQDFSIMGIIVRKVVISENKILYGCKLSVESAKLSAYINKKQRQQLALSRDISAYETKKLLEKALKETSSDEKLSNKNGAMGFVIDNGRNIGEVDVEERRKVFKDAKYGKRV